MLITVVWCESPHVVVETANLTWKDEASVWGQKSVGRGPWIFRLFRDVLVFKGIFQESNNPKWSVQIFFPHQCISKELSLICLIFLYWLATCTVLFGLTDDFVINRTSWCLSNEISATTTKHNYCCLSTPITLSSDNKTFLQEIRVTQIKMVKSFSISL